LFLAAELIDFDYLHIVMTPIVFGRGAQLWAGFEELEERFDLASASSLGGVIHLTFGRQ
jgi:hypothetical protein